MSTTKQTVLRVMPMRYKGAEVKPKIIINGRSYTEAELEKINWDEKNQVWVNRVDLNKCR